MPYHQELIDAVRGFLAQADQTMSDRLRGLADDFAAVCRQADLRLRRCEDYLRNGLTGEAIHLAEVEPPLLGILAPLDFPDRDQWDEITSLYALPPASRVNVDRAASLNMAYNQHQAIEPLLRENRRLALGKGPLHERLDVLRQLAQADPGNPMWLDDVREFESAAQTELARLCEDAYRANESATLHRLVGQMENGAWMVPPAPALRVRSRQLLDMANLSHARKVLPPILRDLDAATRRDDVNAAMALLRRAEEEISRAPLPPDDPSLPRIARARDWIQERLLERQAEAEFNVAVAGFVGLLDSHMPFDRLQESWTTLRKHRRPIPVEVQNRYRQLRAEHKSAEEAKHRQRNFLVNGTVLAIAAPIIVVILIFCGWFVVKLLN